MRELPAGTVTLLFTDIEGSTRLLHELGDEYVAVLAEHRHRLREAFGEFGGVEVDTQGDAFFFAFRRAGDALEGAAAAQRALGDGPVRVRMGVHTGEPHVTDEGYVGVDVHRAARVMSTGHGGQIVISEATARLAGSSAGLTDLGGHRLIRPQRAGTALSARRPDVPAAEDALSHEPPGRGDAARRTRTRARGSRLGIAALLRGDVDAARERVEASHEIHGRNPARIPRVWGLAQTTGTLGAIAREQGEDARAEPLLAESARLADEAGVQWWRSGMLAELAALSLRAGRLDETDDRARRSLTLAVELRDRAGSVFGVGLLAALAAARGQVESAGLLWGAIEAERAFAPLGGWQRHREACEALVQRHAGEQLDRARAAGRALELDEAVEHALSVD